jgi:hypothetical protein
MVGMNKLNNSFNHYRGRARAVLAASVAAVALAGCPADSNSSNSPEGSRSQTSGLSAGFFIGKNRDEVCAGKGQPLAAAKAGEADGVVLSANRAQLRAGVAGAADRREGVVFTSAAAGELAAVQFLEAQGSEFPQDPNDPNRVALRIALPKEPGQTLCARFAIVTVSPVAPPSNAQMIPTNVGPFINMANPGPYAALPIA